MRGPKTFFRRTANVQTLQSLSEHSQLGRININQGRIFMAITRDKKNTLVADLSEVLSTTKITVFAQYQGLSVADIQELRRAAREDGVTIRVVKNRLVRVALGSIDTYKNTDASVLTGQLLYAMSDADEVAPVQVLNTFAKTHPALAFVGAFSSDGSLLSADEVKALAGLPSKNQLIAEVVAQLLSPIHDITNALSGNLHALLDGVSAQATN